MTYATDRLYCDADSHIMETKDWISKYTDPEILAKLPEMSLVKSGTKSFEVINDAVAKQRQRSASGVAAVDVVKGHKGWNAPGAFDAAERKAALDDLGFKRQLVFSTFSATQYLHHDDLEVRYGGIRAHNRAMAAFCNQDQRLIAVGQLSLVDPARCVTEMIEGVRLGCGAFWIPGMPVQDKSPGHPDFDVVWQAFCDLNVPFMLHVGPNSPTKAAEYENNGQPRPKDITGAEGGENLRVRDFMLLSIGPQQFLTALVFDGVFERFPTVARRRHRARRRLGAGIFTHARSQPEDIQTHGSLGGAVADQGLRVHSPRGEIHPVPGRERRAADQGRRRRIVHVLQRLSASRRHR